MAVPHFLCVRLATICSLSYYNPSEYIQKKDGYVVGL